MTTLTYLHKVEPGPRAQVLVSYSFNREFYCIYDHDDEVSCNGIIFFGRQELPIVSLDEEQQEKLDLLHQVFIDEFQPPDKIHGEMLRMLLKRLIIKITRIAKEQLTSRKLDNDHIELIRKFNYEVDYNFREKKTVKEYADLLFKAPKTLSNLFSPYNPKTPLQIIHERIVLEARRLLIYSDKSAKEISYELGFTELSTFYKIFKKYMQQSPQQFRDAQKK